MSKSQGHKLPWLLAKTAGRCFWCKRPVVYAPAFSIGRDVLEITLAAVRYYEDGVIRHILRATVDHVVPRSKGGTNHDDNLVPACLECNGKRNVAEFPGKRLCRQCGSRTELKGARRCSACRDANLANWKAACGNVFAQTEEPPCHPST